MKIQGIYGIRNLATNKWYIGSSMNIKVRKQRHLRDLRTGKHNGVKLLRAWQKYEEPDWEWVVLEEVKEIDQLLIREQHWIDTLNSYHGGYNALPHPGQGSRGLKRSPESIAKFVATRRANGGFIVTDDMKKRIGDTQRGRKNGPMSEEQKKLLSRIRKEGMTEEEKKACGDRARGRVYTEEQKERMGNSHRGFVASEETKKKMSAAAKGKSKSPESIKKMLVTKMEKGQKLSQEILDKYGISYKETK